MERAEIAELFYNALIDLNNLEKLARFLSSRVQWTLSTADPQTPGEEFPPNAIKFSGKEGCIEREGFSFVNRCRWYSATLAYRTDFLRLDPALEWRTRLCKVLHNACASAA